MSWRSPWRFRPFVAAIAAVRGTLSVVGRSDAGFIRWLVDRNNRRVERRLRRDAAASVLLILPRCVKRACCKVENGGSLRACVDCSECHLGDLARIADRYGVEALVAFRSHVAFAMARDRRPDLIIATACEDRLIKALRSVPEIPALLAPLTGMDRMCVNATFDLDWFETQLRRVAAGRRAPAGASLQAGA